MKIGTCQGKRGEVSRGELRVATDAQAGSIAIPIWALQESGFVRQVLTGAQENSRFNRAKNSQYRGQTQ